MSLEIGRVTIPDYDLRDALWQIEKLRAEHPNRKDDPVNLNIMSENYVTGRKCLFSITHHSKDRTFVIVEREA